MSNTSGPIACSSWGGVSCLFALLESVHEFAEAPTQDPAGTGAAETVAQLVEQAADTRLPSSSGSAGPESAEKFSDLVPVLVAGDREQS